MRIYLQTPATPDHAPKFCHLMLQEDLIDGWTLIREAGAQGKAGRVKRQHFESRDSAMDALISARDQQIQKGFRVVFFEGQANR